MAENHSLCIAVSGREWNDIPRQTYQLKEEHGDDFDTILIFIGTNDYNNAVPIGRWYDERMESVEITTFGTRRSLPPRNSANGFMPIRKDDGPSSSKSTRQNY